MKKSNSSTTKPSQKSRRKKDIDEEVVLSPNEEEEDTVDKNCITPPDEDLQVKIDIEDLSNGDIKVDKNGEYYWEGTGILDTMASFLDKQLSIQYSKGRIQGTDYATVYTSLLAEAMRQSITWINISKDLEFKGIMTKKSITTEKIKQESLLAQVRIYYRQLQGFDDNLLLKLFQALLDAFGMMFSSGMLETIDVGPLNAKNLQEMYNKIFEIAEKIKSCPVDDRMCGDKTGIKM